MSAKAMNYRLPAAMLVFLMLAASTAERTLADAAKGSQLAQQWCASCHVTGGTPAANLQQGPPSFSTIARARTAEQLRPSCRIRTARCRNLSLTRAEIDDLVGYIETLR